MNEARAISEAADGDNWLLNGRTFDEQHFSPLKEITDKNVSSLGLAWYLDIDSGMGIVSEPIVVDGVAYVSAPLSMVYAVDAASGKLLWKFDPKIRLDLAINGSYSARTNGGVAVWNGKVYVGTGDCRLIAIDAASGKQLWDAAVCDATQTGITGAPHVAKGKILMGYNGSDDGVRGSLAAYDAETGKEAWRFWTVPGDPAKGFETKALEMAAKTWSGKDSWKIGGGDAWTAITYDPVTGLVIFGTAGAGVDYGELSSIKVAGDKLFAGCIIAVNAETGEYAWHFQTSAPGLQTENNHILIADLVINGEKRHVAMTAPKNGFFYVLDAKTGKLLSAKPLVKLAWANSIDLKTGRADEVPPSRRRRKTMDRPQLVAHELQRAHRTGVRPGNRPEVRVQHSGGVGRVDAWHRRQADRVGSGRRVCALVGAGTHRDQRRRSLDRRQSGFPGTGLGRICRLRRRQREKSLVDSNRLGHRVHSGDIQNKRRAVRLVPGGMGIGIAIVRARLDHGDSAIKTRAGAPAGVQTWSYCAVPGAAGCRATRPKTSAADCQRGNYSQGLDSLRQIRLRWLSLAGYRRQRRLGAQRRDSRSALRAAGSSSRLVRHRPRRHALGQGNAGLRRSSKIRLPQSEDDERRCGCNSCLRD